jgi:hypothetical protein
MNCRPLQRAMVTRNTAGQPCVDASMGRPVHVLEISFCVTPRGPRPFWLCEGMPEPCRAGCGKVCEGFLDDDLTPLPDLSPEGAPSDADIDADLEQRRELEADLLQSDEVRT